MITSPYHFMAHQVDKTSSKSGIEETMSTTDPSSIIEPSPHLSISDHPIPKTSTPNAITTSAEIPNAETKKTKKVNHHHQVPKGPNKRSFVDTGDSKFEPRKSKNSCVRAAYTCDLIWPLDADLGSSEYGSRVQKMISDTMAVFQQGIHRLTA